MNILITKNEDFINIIDMFKEFVTVKNNRRPHFDVWVLLAKINFKNDNFNNKSNRIYLYLFQCGSKCLPEASRCSCTMIIRIIESKIMEKNRN